MKFIKSCELCLKPFTCRDAYDFKRRKYCSSRCAALSGKPRNKQYSFNEEYFDSIDTAEKAYWLGFLYADGCNSNSRIIIRLSTKDRLQLEKFKAVIEAEQPIVDEIINYNYRGQKKTKLSSSITICGNQFSKGLANIGMIEAKTYTLTYPSIPNEFNRHFIRGYFDGDGWINKIKNKSNKRWAIFSASPDFIIQMKSIIEFELNITLSQWIHNKSYKKGITISAIKNNYIAELYKYLYTDAISFMERKHDIFLL